MTKKMIFLVFLFIDSEKNVNYNSEKGVLVWIKSFFAKKKFCSLEFVLQKKINNESTKEKRKGSVFLFGKMDRKMQHTGIV